MVAHHFHKHQFRKFGQHGLPAGGLKSAAPARANRHCESAFLPTEVISSDFCRGVVDDDENSLDATDDAFDLVHKIAEKWLDFLNSDHQIEL
jgi:hypothetical protein